MTLSDPIRKSVEVPLSPIDAFDLFTEKMGTWWPLEDKSVSASNGHGPSKGVRVDPREGGQVIETMATDEETSWGEVLEWCPGERFRMTWHPGRAVDMPTEVTVTFVPVGNGCRVDLTHSGFERYDNGSAVKAGYDQGWGAIMGTLYARAAQAMVATV